MLPIGQYYIRSEAPWQGYLQGKLCYIAEDAECQSAEDASFMATVTGFVSRTNDAGFVSFRSLFKDLYLLKGEQNYLAVRKIENDEMSGRMLEEEENFSGRLFLSNNRDPSSLEETQFELFVPPNATNVANEKTESVRAIIKSVSNGRFISIKPGGNPFATEKDPALATVFSFERELRFLLLWLTLTFSFSVFRKQKSIIVKQAERQKVPYSKDK